MDRLAVYTQYTQQTVLFLNGGVGVYDNDYTAHKAIYQYLKVYNQIKYLPPESPLKFSALFSLKGVNPNPSPPPNSINGELLSNTWRISW